MANTLFIKFFLTSTFLLSSFIGSAVTAQDMGAVPYGSIPIPPAVAIDPYLSSDGQRGSISGPILFSGGEIGKSFSGLTIDERNFYGEKFDDLAGVPSDPLTMETGRSGANLWLGILDKNDKGKTFVSGVTAFGMRQVGAGSIAIRFDEPICQFAFRARVNTPLRPISGNYLRGPIGVIFYAKDGTSLGEFLLGRDDTKQYGFSLPTGSLPTVYGLTIENIDEEGIQIFDMKYLKECMPFVS